MFGLQVAVKRSVTVLFNRKKNILLFIGPLGRSTLAISSKINIKKKCNLIVLSSSLSMKPLVFSFFSLIQKKIIGVSQGFFVFLTINGLGWQVHQDRNTLIFKLGFSTLKYLPIPQGIEAVLLNKQNLKIFGLDLDAVKHFVCQITKLRKLDFYKGKGLIQNYKKIKLKISSKFK